MVKIELSTLARVNLYYWISGIGPVTPEVQDLHESLENAVALSKQEDQAIGLVEDAGPDGKIRISWKPQADAMKEKKEVEFETDHAKKLLVMMASYPAFKHDREWTRETIKALKAAV